MRPKCTTPNCTGELKFQNAIDAYPSLLGFWRCNKCFQTHQFVFGAPYLSGTYDDPLRLTWLHSDELWSYFECYQNGELKTLVAKKGPYVSVEQLEAMGYDKVVYKGLEREKLPGHRLCELK